MRRLAALFLILFLASGAAAGAQDRPGDFDFYVLSLSWSPTFCATEATAADRLQCGAGRSHGFIVHGLWPQRERGYPEFCRAEPRRAPAQLVRSMLDLMPSEGLVRHEWEKHGSCSGLSPEGYFALTRQARTRVTVPPGLESLDSRATVDPDDIEAAFLRANPGLPGDAIAVTCGLQRLDEVRICLTKDLAFRSCPEVDARSCRASRVTVPPIP